MKEKKVASTIILVLVLSIGFAVLNSFFVKATETQKLKAEALLQILDQNNMSIVSAFNKFDEQNITVVEAENAYNDGRLHAKEAINLMTQEKYDEACNETIKAMQKFEETLRLLEANFSTSPTTVEASAEEVLHLKYKIVRANKYVDQIENLVLKATQAGYSTLVIERPVEQIKVHLATSLQSIRDLDLKEAAREFSVAKGLFDQLAEPLERLRNLVTKSNTERYLQEAEVRISAAKMNITTSVSLTPDIKEEAINALNNSEASLANAKDDIQKNEVPEAITDLEEAKKWEELYNDTLSSVTDSQSLNSADESLTNSDIISSTNVVQP